MIRRNGAAVAVRGGVFHPEEVPTQWLVLELGFQNCRVFMGKTRKGW